MIAPRPRISILGVGAVGGTVAAALGDAGHRPELAARTRFDGLTRELGGHTVRYDFPIVTEPRDATPADWLLLCTKAYQSAAAAQWFPSLVTTDTTVAVLQNGVDQVERLSAFVPAERIIPVVVQMACHRDAPGRVSQTRVGKLFVPDSDRGRKFAGLFSGTEALEVVTEAAFVDALWRKLAINATTGAICALTLRQNEVINNAEVRALAAELMTEVMAVGSAEGASFPDGFVDQMLDTVAGPVGSHWTSIAADRRDGRAMEWEVRNAVVGRLGRKHGVPTPLNDVMATLLSVAH